MDTEKNAYEIAFQRATNPSTRDDFWYFNYHHITLRKE